jgi:hypothetical protein
LWPDDIVIPITPVEETAKRSPAVADLDQPVLSAVGSEEPPHLQRMPLVEIELKGFDAVPLQAIEPGPHVPPCVRTNLAFRHT